MFCDLIKIAEMPKFTLDKSDLLVFLKNAKWVYQADVVVDYGVHSDFSLLSELWTLLLWRSSFQECNAYIAL